MVETALFGNLIPVFSTIEAIMLLGEKITYIHVISFLLVIVGLLVDNATVRQDASVVRRQS